MAVKNSAKQETRIDFPVVRLTVVHEFHDLLVLRTLTGLLLLLLLHMMLTVVMHLVLVLVLSLRGCMEHWFREA